MAHQPAQQFRPGLVSITFRAWSVTELVALAADAGLTAIEWGGDVHVPHGDRAAAERASAVTREAGLTVAAYGSYYRLGHSEDAGLTFATVLDTAVALGAAVVRVWAGPNNPRGVAAPDDPVLFEAVAEDLRRTGAMAADAGVVVALEYHPSTFTADAGTARRLLEAAGQSPAIRTLWQPNPYEDDATQDRSLDTVLPWLRHVHAFAWRAPRGGGPRTQHPFAEHAGRWAGWLGRIAGASGGRTVEVLLEFVRGDDPEQLKRDAEALRAVIKAVESA